MGSVHGWAVVHVCEGELEEVLSTVVRAMARVGLRERSEAREDGRVRLEFTQGAGWVRIVWAALPQRAIWWLERGEGRLIVASDFRLFGWYRSLLLFFCLAIGAGFAFDARTASRSSALLDGHWPLGTMLLLLALGLVPLTFRLLQALGGRQVEAVWSEVLAPIERSRQFVDRPGTAVFTRYNLSMLGYLGYFLALGCCFLSYSVTQKGTLVVVLMPLSLIGLLLVALGCMVWQRGFSLRVYALHSGLATSLSALFFSLSLSLPWWTVSSIDPSRLGPRQAAVLAALAVGLSTLLLASAFAWLYYGVSRSHAVRSALLRLSAQHAHGIYRQAVGGRKVLRSFRRVFLTWWLLVSALVGTAMCFSMACGLQAIRPIRWLPGLHLVSVSMNTLSSACGQPRQGALSQAMRGAWALHGVAAALLLLLSAAQHWRARRATRQELRAACMAAGAGRPELTGAFARASRAAGLPALRLAVAAGADRAAFAYQFGWLQPERFIEVTAGCLERLSPGEFAALIAHECGHLLSGHCARDNALFWLGRLSFTGDSFVRALMDSFDDEEQADDRARALEVAEADLAGCLSEAGRGPSAVALPPAVMRQDWRLGWWLFRAQYCGDAGGLHLYYWHPPAVERLVARVEGAPATGEQS
jgi:Zn-dependent protease with chaperone function